VFFAVQDPVSLGLVTSFAQPGGNITGFTNLEPSVVSQYVQLLVTVAPNLSRVALVFNPAAAQQVANAFRPFFLPAAAAAGVEPLEVPVASVEEIEPTIASLAENPNTGVFIGADNFFFTHRVVTIAAINRARLPAVFHSPQTLSDGALMTYSYDSDAAMRGAGNYVGRILNGEDPGSLPVQPPTRFLLAINLRTARQLGITIPPSLLAAAETIIE
jgi:putative ABC transport system substrate-binding protein